VYTYPLNFRFAVFDIGDRITITDGNAQILGAVQQKAFRLKEDVSVYDSESQDRLLYRIRADQFMDISGSYSITDAEGSTIGTVVRHGMRSFWQASYEIKDHSGGVIAHTTERNPAAKLAEGLLEAVPFIGGVLGGVVGYFVNPKYDMNVPDGRRAYIVKHRSLLEGRFTLESESSLFPEEERGLLPAVVMMIILERARG